MFQPIKFLRLKPEEEMSDGFTTSWEESGQHTDLEEYHSAAAVVLYLRLVSPSTPSDAERT